MFTTDSLGDNFTVRLGFLLWISLGNLGNLNDKKGHFSFPSKMTHMSVFSSDTGAGMRSHRWVFKKRVLFNNEENNLQNMQHKLWAHNRGQLNRTKTTEHRLNRTEQTKLTVTN